MKIQKLDKEKNQNAMHWSLKGSTLAVNTT